MTNTRWLIFDISEVSRMIWLTCLTFLKSPFFDMSEFLTFLSLFILPDISFVTIISQMSETLKMSEITKSYKHFRHVKTLRNMSQVYKMLEVSNNDIHVGNVRDGKN